MHIFNALFIALIIILEKIVKTVNFSLSFANVDINALHEFFSLCYFRMTVKTNCQSKSHDFKLFPGNFQDFSLDDKVFATLCKNFKSQKI